MNKYQVLVVKRTAEWQQIRVAELRASSPEASEESLNARAYHGAVRMAWRVDIEKAKSADFIFVVSENVVVGVARVLGAEKVSAKLAIDNWEGQVLFATLATVPDFVEGLLGEKVDMPGRNPVAWAELTETCGVVVSLKGKGVVLA